MSWDKLEMKEALDLLPGGRAKYSTRIWEVQCAAQESKEIEQWYQLSLRERTLKVTAMIVPGWLMALDTRYPKR